MMQDLIILGFATLTAVSAVLCSLGLRKIGFKEGALLAAVFAGREPENPPNFGQVIDTMREHAHLLCEWIGERIGIRDFRKHATWYTKGFPGSTKMRDKLIRIESLAELNSILDEGDRELYFPPRAMRLKRGKKGGTQRVMLPEGFRDDLDDATPPAAEEPGDGG